MLYPAETVTGKTIQALKNKNYDRGRVWGGGERKKACTSEIKHKTWQIIELEQTTTLQR